MNTRTALILATALAAVSFSASAADAKLEKCYGIAKAGKNDCAGPGHVCAGLAKQDADPEEYVNVPKGTCERIVGGKLKSPAT